MSSPFTVAANSLADAIKLLDGLTPSSRQRPDKYHEDKSELRRLLVFTKDLCTGNIYNAAPAASPAPATEPVRKPGFRCAHDIKDRRGNVVRVEFAPRRRLGDNPPIRQA